MINVVVCQGLLKSGSLLCNIVNKGRKYWKIFFFVIMLIFWIFQFIYVPFSVLVVKKTIHYQKNIKLLDFQKV